MIRTYLLIQTLALATVLGMAFQQNEPRVRWSMFESLQVRPSIANWSQL